MMTIEEIDARYQHVKYVVPTRISALKARLRGYVYTPLKTEPRIVTPLPKLGSWRMFETGEMQILTEVSIDDVRLDGIAVNKERLTFCKDMIKLGFGLFPPTLITNTVNELVPVRPEKLIAQNVLGKSKVVVWYSPSHEKERAMPRWMIPVSDSDPETIAMYKAKHVVKKYGDIPSMSMSAIIDECIEGR